MNNKRWSKEEIDKLNTLLNNNVKQSTIAKELNRSITSVQLKIKRLKLKEGTYNEKHQLNKYLANVVLFNLLSQPMQCLVNKSHVVLIMTLFKNKFSPEAVPPGI